MRIKMSDTQFKQKCLLTSTKYYVYVTNAELICFETTLIRNAHAEHMKYLHNFLR